MNIKTLMIYERLLGDKFDTLPSAVQSFHRLTGVVKLRGEVLISSPHTIPAAISAFVLRTPRIRAQQPFVFELNARPEMEIWTRYFPSQTMTSQLHAVGGELHEILGPLRLVFKLSVVGDALTMQLLRLSIFGLTLPHFLLPKVSAEEKGQADRFFFNVIISLPWFGVVTSDQGFLSLPDPIQCA